jgi:hypothetical protein
LEGVKTAQISGFGYRGAREYRLPIRMIIGLVITVRKDNPTEEILRW